MKILNVGVGVIGTAYSWQLSEAGNDVSMLVRKGKKLPYEQNGIQIECIDFREKDKRYKVTFRPKIVDDFSANDAYELIIVAVKYDQLESILPLLKDKAGRADILFLQNNWIGIEEIEKFLSPNQYLLGFCQLLGGAQAEQGITCAISSSKMANTMLGETNGKTSDRLKKIFSVFREANLSPKISNVIIPWLIAHYAMIAALYAGILKAGGSIKLLAGDSTLLKETLYAMRDGFAVCKTKSLDPKKVPPHGLFYLPRFIMIPILKKIYGKPDMQIIFDGHLSNSWDEIQKMYYDVLSIGKLNNVSMPYFSSFEKYFEKLEKVN